MTDPFISNTTTTVQTFAPPTATFTTSPAFPPPTPESITNGNPAQEEDEDYTIKCICKFNDDDGSTILCDKCGTWQHIQCYYMDRPPPGDDELHYCVDCDYRNLDVKLATERQRYARNTQLMSAERKAKKPTPKTKRKLKTAEHSYGETNGGGSDRNGHASPRGAVDGHHAPGTRRARGGHRTSSSASVLPLKMPAQSRRSASTSHGPSDSLRSPGSPPSESPAEPFSLEFMHLHDDDANYHQANANAFDSLSISNELSTWSVDVDELSAATGGKTHQDIFMRCDQPLDPVDVSKHDKIDKSAAFHNVYPQWKFITVDGDTPKDAFAGELFGRIGHMREYVDEASNRWEYLRHPLPFVFFHPHLPIYIDTRQEGNVFRYLRRSCSPNLTMKTILESSDYHFCFVVTKDLEPGTELTIPWTLDEHVRAFFKNRNGGLLYEGSTETDEEYVANWARRVMADFGGCACNDPATCTMSQWDRRNLESMCQPPIKGRRGKHASARGIGSRSESEALKLVDEDDVDDNQTASSSSRSKPQSRDNTPSNQIDAKNILQGDHISDREKRKIEALERNALEKPSKKPKRRSGDPRHRDSVPNTPATKKEAGQDTGISMRELQAPLPGTASREDTSPPQPRTSNGSAVSKSKYIDVAIQCDMGKPPLLTISPSANFQRKKPILFKDRLRMRCFQQARLTLEAERGTSPSVDQETPISVSNPADQAQVIEMKDAEGDIAMHDGGSNPVLERSPSQLRPEKPRPPDSDVRYPVNQLEAHPIAKPPPPPQPWLQSTLEAQTIPGRNPGLHLHVPPPQPTQATMVSSGMATPAPTIVTVQSPMQTMTSPFVATPSAPGNLVQPSPAKKKLSLGDYMNRRNSSKVETPIAPESHKPLPSFKEEAVDQILGDGAMVDTPVAERANPIEN